MNERGVADGGRVELLPGHRCADNGEDARADDGSDAERSERPGPERLFERVFGFFRLADQFINGLAGKQLAGQGSFLIPKGYYRQDTEFCSGEERGRAAVSFQSSV
jgi:hypothetical protein